MTVNSIVTEVASKIFLIDNGLFNQVRWGSTYFLNEEHKALVDTGPASSVPNDIEGLHKLGIKPEDIDYIILTHIHLDHAGGAGALAQMMPRAKVVVHSRGAKHIANPERLIKSVIEVQGQEIVDSYGPVIPIPAERIMSIDGETTINLGSGQTLKLFDAPGHATHQLGICESRNNGIFPGDSAGLYVEKKYTVPVSPGPSFDLELFISTVNRYLGLKPARIYYAHFGVSDKAANNLQLAIEGLREWEKIIARAFDEGNPDSAPETIATTEARRLTSLKLTNPGLFEYLTGHSIPVSAAGFVEYYKNKHQA